MNAEGSSLLPLWAQPETARRTSNNYYAYLFWQSGADFRPGRLAARSGPLSGRRTALSVGADGGQSPFRRVVPFGPAATATAALRRRRTPPSPRRKGRQALR